MVLYKCNCCNYTTTRKYDFRRHLKTIKHINNYKNYVGKNDEENKKGLKRTQKDSKRTLDASKKDSKRTQKGLIAENAEKNFNCEFCNTAFKTRPIMLRHLRKYCKKKQNQFSNEIIEKQIQIIESQSNQIDKFEKLLEKSIQINNTQNNDNSNNKTINNIHINNYGEENLEMLTDDFKKQCVRHPYKALVNIIEKIHFNDDYPENKNIRLLNKRDNKIQVKNNGKWNYKDKEEALRYAIDDSNEKLEQFYDEKSKQFRKIIRLSCKEIIKNVQESNTELLKNLYKELDLVLFNN